MSKSIFNTGTSLTFKKNLRSSGTGPKATPQSSTTRQLATKFTISMTVPSSHLAPSLNDSQGDGAQSTHSTSRLLATVCPSSQPIWSSEPPHSAKISQCIISTGILQMPLAPSPLPLSTTLARPGSVQLLPGLACWVLLKRSRSVVHKWTTKNSASAACWSACPFSQVSLHAPQQPFKTLSGGFYLLTFYHRKFQCYTKNKRKTK